MRILANYGYKNNGDSYSVTFETTGDVPIEKASTTVDDLFKLVKEAIQRQIVPKNKGIDPLADALPDDKNYQGVTGNNKKTGNENGEDYSKSAKNNGAKITANQKKFLYQLLFNNKKLSEDATTAYLKKEFKVQYINEILCQEADLFIKKLLKEMGQSNPSNK